MDARTSRLQAIKRLIQNEKISNQEELLDHLLMQGFDLTQATVSRDLKLLQVGKKADPEKGNVFFLPDQQSTADNLDNVDTLLFTAAIRAVHFANQFGIIKTLPGYASSIAIMVDKASRYEIVGTIAGDDTILVIPEQDITHHELKKAIQVIFPGLEEHAFKPRP